MAKETTTKIIIAIVAIVALIATTTTTIVATSYVSGKDAGRVEQKVVTVNKSIDAYAVKVEKHEEAIDLIQRKQAYQEGVVNTKLENLEKGIIRIEQTLSNWESDEDGQD